ncbi:hypothetical protein GCM10025867_13770 [Frondihabitans sucicola]|uniref:Uncharacterized protein n=1 Tax=Frondihabitans sucicola TaxID=1268041 RepID=A0ABN6XW23_9MICO|nr:hypothetical protein GCM10025867_13770 [Frondihabitans sucicola]
MIEIRFLPEITGNVTAAGERHEGSGCCKPTKSPVGGAAADEFGPDIETVAGSHDGRIPNPSSGCTVSDAACG